MQMPSFMIPAGETSIASPQEVERKRLIALALMRQGMDTGPTDMWGGVARLGQSVVGALMNRKADRQEQAGRDDANKNFTAIMERLMGPSSAGIAPAGGDLGAEVQPSPYEAQGIPDPRSPEFNVIDDRQLPVDPNMIQAQPQGQPPQQAQPQGNEFAQMDQLPMGEIIGLLSNPYLQPGQAQFLQSFVQNKMNTGTWVNLGDGRIMNNATGEVTDIGQREQPVDPLEAEKTRAEIARINADRARIENQPDNSLQAQIGERSAVAKQMGLTEGTPEYQSYVLNGQLPRPENDRATSTQLKELWSSQDELPVLDSTLDSLARAKELNDKTFTGYTAGARGWAGTAIPGANMLFDENAAKATREFGQLMTYEAIQAMSQTLKGATTDRELAKFVEILADPSTPPDIRGRTIDRMMNLAAGLKRIKQQRIQELGGDAPAASPAATGDGWQTLPNGAKIRKKAN